MSYFDFENRNYYLLKNEYSDDKKYQILVDNSLRSKRRKIQMNKRKKSLKISSSPKKRILLSTEEIFKKYFPTKNKSTLKKKINVSMKTLYKNNNDIQIDSCNSSTKEDDINVNISDLDCSFKEEEVTFKKTFSQNSSFIKLKNSLITKKYNYYPLNITDSYIQALNSTFKNSENSMNKYNNINTIKEENEIENYNYKKDKKKKSVINSHLDKSLFSKLNLLNCSNWKKKLDLTFNINKHRKFITILNENLMSKKRILSSNKQLKENSQSQSKKKVIRSESKNIRKSKNKSSSVNKSLSKSNDKCKNKKIISLNNIKVNKNDLLKVINNLQYDSINQYGLLIKNFFSYRNEILKILVKYKNNKFYFNGLYKLKNMNNNNNMFNLYLIDKNTFNQYPKIINKNNLKNLYEFDMKKNKFIDVSLTNNNQDFILFTL